MPEKRIVTPEEVGVQHRPDEKRIHRGVSVLFCTSGVEMGYL